MSSDEHARARALWRYTGEDRPLFAMPNVTGQESVWDYPRPPKLLQDGRDVGRELCGRRDHTHPPRPAATRDREPASVLPSVRLKSFETRSSRIPTHSAPSASGRVVRAICPSLPATRSRHVRGGTIPPRVRRTRRSERASPCIRVVSRASSNGERVRAQDGWRVLRRMGDERDRRAVEGRPGYVGLVTTSASFEPRRRRQGNTAMLRCEG